MGLLDQVVGKVSGALAGGQGASLGRAALELLNSEQVGGVQGLASRLEQHGLGNVVQSWIGTGANLPISADQLQAALGPDTVAAVARKVGVPPEQAQQALAQLLPQLVDKLTPNGQVPQQQDLMQAGLTALKSILG